MKYASVYRRTGRKVWYISFLNESGRREHRATVHQIEAPASKRRAYDEAVELSKKARSTFQGVDRGQVWETWVPGWMKLHYRGSPLTLQRYETVWSHLFEFLQEKGLLVPRSVTYSAAGNYLEWRISQKRRRGTQINYNTALLELRFLSSVMREAVRRGFAEGNPLAQLGLGRQNVKEKPEITAAEEARIRSELRSRPVWMQDCFDVGMAQGCRLTETATPLAKIDLARGTITFKGKGNKVFTTMLHPTLRPLAQRKFEEGARNLVDLPAMPAKCWWQFFREVNLPHLCFHSTRVSVVTRLCRAGVPQGVAQSYVGHSDGLVHRIYQRLSVADLSAAVNAIHGTPATPGDPAPTAQISAG